MNNLYHRQVALLIRVMPLVYRIKEFAVHGGTAINLFHRKLQNINLLKKNDPGKHSQCVEKLINHFKTSEI